LHKWIRRILIVFFAILFLGSGYYVFTYYWEGHQQQESFSELGDIVDSVRQQETEPTEDVQAEPLSPYVEVTDAKGNTRIMLREYAALYELNPDVIGWITIEDTVIDYPVMQTPQHNDFYLRKAWDKTYSTRGCIYAREVCDVFEPSDNVTIYGHRMRDGSMFGSLGNYKKKSYWENHRYIQFDTLSERHTYEIVTVFQTTADDVGFAYHLFVDAADEAEYDEFIATGKSLQYFDTGITPHYGEKLITLSTCEKSVENGRLVVVARRTD